MPSIEQAFKDKSTKPKIKYFNKKYFPAAVKPHDSLPGQAAGCQPCRQLDVLPISYHFISNINLGKETTISVLGNVLSVHILHSRHSDLDKSLFLENCKSGKFIKETFLSAELAVQPWRDPHVHNLVKETTDHRNTSEDVNKLRKMLFDANWMLCNQTNCNTSKLHNNPNQQK